MDNNTTYESSKRIKQRESLGTQLQEKYQGQSIAELRKKLAELTDQKNSIENTPDASGQAEYILIREEINFLTQLIKEHGDKPD